LDQQAVNSPDMNKIPISLLAVFALTACAVARDDYAINKIQANFIQTPLVGYVGNTHPNGPQQTWMEVEVEFKSFVDITEQLEFKYYIYIENKCLTGSVTHVNVPKGLNLLSVMYVSPPALARLSGGKSSTKNIQEVTIQILSKGQLVAQKSMKNTPGEWWAKLDQDTGTVLNKNETPFAPLYWDRYVEIKPAAH
jgi:hypothetical protein